MLGPESHLKEITSCERNLKFCYSSPIELEHLDQNETCKIATQNAASVMGAADKTVIVTSPIISIDEVRALTTDGTLKTVKGNYVILLAVSEVEYKDGTKWELGAVPWRSKTQ